MEDLDLKPRDGLSLDELLEHALRAHLIDHYDNRGLCVVIRCGDRTYTSSRRHARSFVHDLLHGSPRPTRNVS